MKEKSEYSKEETLQDNWHQLLRVITEIMPEIRELHQRVSRLEEQVKASPKIVPVDKERYEKKYTEEYLDDILEEDDLLDKINKRV